MPGGPTQLPVGIVQQSAQTVGTVAVALGSNGGLQGRTYITIFNAGGGGNLYAGGSNVTTADGVAFASNATPFTFSTPQGESIYGISNIAGTLVKTIEG